METDKEATCGLNELAQDLTIEQVRDWVKEKVLFAAQHPITEDYEIAEKLQCVFEQGRLWTLSVDGTSAQDSHMGRSGPLQVNGSKMWCHTVLVIGEIVVDLWHQPSVVMWRSYWDKVSSENFGTRIRVFDEDACEEIEVE